MAVAWKQVLKAGDNNSLLTNDEGFTNNTGDITGVTTGTGLAGDGTSGGINLTLALDGLPDMTGVVVGSVDQMILLDNDVESRKQLDEIALSAFNNDNNWTSNTGDITGVDLTGGTGIAIASETNTTSGSYSSTINCNLEGTELISTGESGGTKFLREDGNGTCSWQTASASDVDVNNANLLTRLGNLESTSGTTDQVIPIGLDVGDTMSFRGNVTVAGNMIVNGTTTTINTANLEVEDHLILLATNGTPTNDTGSLAGIMVETNASVANCPELKWTKDLGTGNTDGSGVANGLTGWSVENMYTSNHETLPIAVMKFKAGALTTEQAGGIGSLGYDTSGQNLYIRINDVSNP